MRLSELVMSLKPRQSVEFSMDELGTYQVKVRDGSKTQKILLDPAMALYVGDEEEYICKVIKKLKVAVENQEGSFKKGGRKA